MTTLKKVVDDNYNFCYISYQEAGQINYPALTKENNTMINTSVKQFIYDRLMVTSVAGVFTKDIALGMRNCRTLVGDNKRAIVISDYKGVSYLLGIRLAVNTLAMTVELLDSDRDYHTMLEKYMTMDSV